MTIMNLKAGYLEYRLHGESRRVNFNVGEDFRWEHGSVTWRIDRVLDGDRIKAVCELEENSEFLSATLESFCSYPPDSSVFCNGFQSWTTSREYSVNERIPSLSPLARLFSMEYFGDYHFISPFRKGSPLYSHCFSYVRRGVSVAFVGSLCENEGYTFFLHDPPAGRMVVRRDCEGIIRRHSYLLFDLFLCEGTEETAFESYFALIGLRGKRRSLAGWTSWYNYYTGIDESIILRNLDAFVSAGIPANIFQIDDGYQTSVGDWLSLKPTFPRGMKFIAEKIRAAGYRPGIWLAPFVCSKNSRVRAEHPEWILTDSGDRQVRAGWNPGWDGPFFVMDIYNEGFRNYLEQVFRTVTADWGYEVLKLDFLYAAGMLPRLGKSRGEVMAEGVKFLADIAGSAEILGCGVPLSSCFGDFSFCRIGSDVAPKWEDRLLKSIGYRERVSTINSLISSIGRHRLSGRAFLNDPDVFILREGVKLDRTQRMTLFLLNVIFGDILFISDNIAEYPPDTMELYRSLYPVRTRKVLQVEQLGDLRIIDFKVDNRDYRAYANLDGRSGIIEVPAEKWALQAQTWSSSGSPIGDRASGSFEIKPFGILYFQRLDDTLPQVSGGSGHLFPAVFIESIEMTGEEAITVSFSRDAPPGLKIDIIVPRPGKYTVNGKIRSAEIRENGKASLVYST